MSPLASARAHISATASLCRGSVVRMKSSLRMPIAPPGLLKLRGDLVAVGLRVDAALAGDALDLLAVLVEAGQEEDVRPCRRARW